MQTHDNSYYLNHDFLGRDSVRGAVFLDYRNDGSFTDDISIIYGHRMNGRLMFSDVARYEDYEFLMSHSQGELILRSGEEYKISAEEYKVISAYDDMYRFLDSNKHSGKIILSTCEKGDAGLRDILVLSKAF